MSDSRATNKPSRDYLREHDALLIQYNKLIDECNLLVNETKEEPGRKLVEKEENNKSLSWDLRLFDIGMMEYQKTEITPQEKAQDIYDKIEKLRTKIYEFEKKHPRIIPSLSSPSAAGIREENQHLPGHHSKYMVVPRSFRK